MFKGKKWVLICTAKKQDTLQTIQTALQSNKIEYFVSAGVWGFDFLFFHKNPKENFPYKIYVLREDADLALKILKETK